MSSTPYLNTPILASLLLLAAFQGVALADNTSSVNLIANGSFDTPGASAFALADGWQALNPWGSVTVGLETGRKYAPYEIRGAGGPRGDKPRKWLARFRGPYHGNICRSQNPQYGGQGTLQSLNAIKYPVLSISVI